MMLVEFDVYRYSLLSFSILVELSLLFVETDEKEVEQEGGLTSPISRSVELSYLFVKTDDKEIVEEEGGSAKKVICTQ
jgi:hypothetical protein